MTYASRRTFSRPLRSSDDSARALSECLQDAGAPAFDRVALVDSGTSALLLAIEAATPGDGIVALPAYGCYDLLTAACGARRRVVFYDLDPATLSPSLPSLSDALAAGATSVVVASTYGYLPDMPAIAAVVRSASALLVEDIAQAVGASWAGAPAGSWGDAVCISFGRGKGVGGTGGGALLLRSGLETLTPLADASATAGARGVMTLMLQQVLALPFLFAIPSAIPALRLGDTVYHAPWAPRQLDRSRASVGVEAVRYNAQQIARRTTVAHAIESTCRAGGGVQAARFVAVPPESRPSFLRLGGFVEDAGLAVSRALGVRRGYPIALPMHPVGRQLNAAAVHSGCYPGATHLADFLASFPTHDSVSESDIERMPLAFATHTT